MNNDAKQRFILMMALGITFFVILEYIMPPPPPAPQVKQEASQQHEAAPAPAGGTAAAVVPTPTADFNPVVEYDVSVRIGDDTPGGDGYEARFSSLGAGMSSYRLLGFSRLPTLERHPGDEVILLDRLAKGRDSFRVDAATFGPSRQELQTLALGVINYELKEVPEWAEVRPLPDPSVKKGDKLVFRAVAGDWELLKTFSFPRDKTGRPYTIDMTLEWRNLAPANRLLRYRLAGPTGLLPDDNTPSFGIINFLTARQPAANAPGVEVQRATLAEVSKVAEDKDKGTAWMTLPDNRAGLAWVGAKNRFFAALMATNSEAVANSNGGLRRAFVADPGLMPKQPDLVANLKYQPLVNAGRGEVPVFEDTALLVDPGMVQAGATYRASYAFYGGPAVDSLMEQADPRFSGVISYTISYFDFISRWLVELLTFLDHFLGNYGLAIIVVTLLVRLCLHPLNRKSFVSMNKMQKLAPQMKALQSKYANDKVKMQQELSKLYKGNNVSMAGGCLPVFLQLPIFFALYGAFSQGFPIRHASFIHSWIPDLSKPDSVYDFGWVVPILNSSCISILPILYLALQYFQMSLQPKPSDPQQASQQRVMKIMPLMFVFIFYSMPAGLVLYFAVSALFGVLENWWMRKVLFPRLGLGDGTDAATAPQAAQAGAGAVEVKSHAKKRRKK